MSVDNNAVMETASFFSSRQFETPPPNFNLLNPQMQFCNCTLTIFCPQIHDFLSLQPQFLNDSKKSMQQTLRKKIAIKKLCIGCIFECI